MKVFIFIVIFMLLSGSVFASTNSGVTYAGRLLTPAGVPVEASNVKFTFEIRSAGSEDCLLYREQQAVNMSGSNGLFTVTMNDGTGVSTTYGYDFEKVFANNQSFTLPGGNCASGTTYTPGVAHGRKLRVYFNDGSFSGWEPLPIMAINYIPMSLTAKNLGGFESGNLLRVENAGVPGTGAALTSSDLTKLLDLIAGTSTQYAPIAAASALSLPTYPGTPTTPAAGSTWYDSSTNQIKFWNGSAVQTLGVSGAGITSLVAGTGLNVGAGPGGTITTSGTLNIDVGTTANKIVQLDGSARLPAVDGSQLTGLTTSQIPNLDASKITSGTLPVARGGTAATSFTANQMIIGNGTGTALQSFLCPMGNILKFNASGVAACDTVAGALGYTPADGINYVAKAGDTMSGTLNLPTNGLVAGTNQLVLSSGNVGIGTTSPSRKLEVQDTIADNRIVLGTTAAVSTMNASSLDLKVMSTTQQRTAALIGAAFTDTTDATRTSSLNFITANSGVLSSAMSLVGTNVGIGTTSPANRLSVYGQMTSGGSPQVNILAPDTGDGSYGAINFQAGSDNIAQNCCQLCDEHRNWARGSLVSHK